jgi:hypothetical protein
VIAAGSILLLASLIGAFVFGVAVQRYRLFPIRLVKMNSWDFLADVGDWESGEMIGIDDFGQEVHRYEVNIHQWENDFLEIELNIWGEIGGDCETFNLEKIWLDENEIDIRNITPENEILIRLNFESV